MDANGNGVLDSTDATVTSIANILTALDKTELAPGDRVLLFSRVQAPASAVGGLSESARIVVNSTLTAPGEATWRIKIRATTRSPKPSPSFPVMSSWSRSRRSTPNATELPTAASPRAGQAANPGECIVYRITATNMGTADATELQIDDATPAYTTYVGSSGTATTGDTEAELTLQPADGATGAIRSEHGTVPSGQVARLTFRVRIDQ